VSFIAAAIIGGGALIGGVVSAEGAKSAAGDQARAAANAQNISEQQYQDTVNRNQPFTQAGYDATNALDYGLGIGPSVPGYGSPSMAYGSLTQPFNTSNWSQLSPDYNFVTRQGSQGVLNGSAAGSGALSGAAMKDLTDYNQSAANTSFNDAFNQYQTQQGNIFSRLSGIASLGQNSANNTGVQGTALAGQAAQSATNIGTAQAGGAVGSANAITGAISSATPWLASSGVGGGGGSLSGAYGANNSYGSGYTFGDYGATEP
jgi:hypothetical protein